MKGHSSREKQEGLAHQYRKLGEMYFATDVFHKGNEYLIKSLKLRIEIHKTYNDLKSAKTLYYGLWTIADHLENKNPDNAMVFKTKMIELVKSWPDIL